MNGTLAPKSLGDILSETFNIYKNNFLRLIAIVAIMQVPIVVLYGIYAAVMLIGLEATDISSNLFTLYILFIPIFLVMFTASIWMGGAVVHVVAEQYFHQPVSIGRAYSFAWRRLGAMFGAVFLVYLALVGIYLAVILIGVVPAIAIGEISTWLIPVMMVFLIFVAVPAIVYLGTNWNFVSQMALLEDFGAIATLSRSWALVKGSWWRVLGIVLLLSFIMQAILMIIMIIFYIPAIVAIISQAASSAFTSYGASDFPTGMIIGIIMIAIGGVIASIMSLPIFIIGHTLLYFDLRVRKEGYSLDVMAEELGLPSTATDTVA